MQDYSEGDVRIDGIKIHYYRTGGDKPAFVLLHGATDNGLCWTPVADKLSKEYDVIMIDAQGHGLSDRLNKDFQYINHAHQTAELIKELKLIKPIIMGHSMGAGTTVNISVEYPDLPKAIVLEDPAWRRQEDLKTKEIEEMKKEHEAFVKELEGYGKRSKEELIEECRKNNPGWSDMEISRWAEAKQQFDPTLFSKLVIDRPTYVELVPRMKCPTLLIIAENGLVTAGTAENAARLWQSEQPFRWVQIKGASHNIRRDQFDAYWKKLTEFLHNLKD